MKAKWLMLPLLVGVIFTSSFIDRKAEFHKKVEAMKLSILSSDLRITSDELPYWDNVIWELIPNTPLEHGAASRLFAYLYVAQKVFADASYALTGAYSGTLEPISVRVIQLFIPQYSDERKEDRFSEELTAVLMQEIEARYKREQANIRYLDTPKNKELWYEEDKHYGLNLPSIEPWALNNGSELRISRPPAQNDPFWKEQARQTKEIADAATEDDKKDVLFWHGETDPRGSDWKSMADRYMEERGIPLQLRLVVRTKLAIAMLDAYIAAYDSKYAYLVKRPSMVDPEINTYIRNPRHPSFPSAHSTVGAAAAYVLSYYFPENVEYWNARLEASGMSRINAGIHFPIDHEAGKQLGAKVGQLVLFRLQN